MTDEERRRTMEFILEQQAQFAVNIQRLEEERIRDRPRLARLEESFLQLVELNKTVDSRLDRGESESRRLEDALVRFTEASDSRLNGLESRATTVDSRLDRGESESRRLEDALVRFTEASDSRLNGLESSATTLEDSFQRLVRLAEITDARLEKLESRLLGGS